MTRQGYPNGRVRSRSRGMRLRGRSRGRDLWLARHVFEGARECSREDEREDEGERRSCGREGGGHMDERERVRS